ncbi:hypothetical protein MTX26_00325 [Bradyrhizobium sp. ISRA443]|uniref:hypothetical protein n=1 Tax=unclassified Bradyrhizobium TaxID=2631580 RepID=UPI002479C928|nr:MULTISPECIES: hypothetical protein [unclassified Bradyrhizobium]WGS02956.1 hypothetical protein MTX23_00325 [Bradyrhizobium sp. ISRA436]WGS09843.1 hypothetical protein MTX18_00325 [Bradyrhizobium sp. ISRA437]WGS16729.1 hypothetical protein MTX26_00325 [Bradyrhizobium sp. ISRA443]
MATTINVAESTDLMTNPDGMTDTIDVQAIKHICLVGNNRAPVQGRLPSLILRSGVSRVSKDEGTGGASWFEKALRASSP